MAAGICAKNQDASDVPIEGGFAFPTGEDDDAPFKGAQNQPKQEEFVIHMEAESVAHEMIVLTLPGVEDFASSTARKKNC